MLTLNKKDTALLKAVLCTHNTIVFLNLEERISANDYEDIREDFASWKVAYENSELYGTNANDSTFQFTGIDQFPIPPQR